jgi:hypothetical protein
MIINNNLKKSSKQEDDDLFLYEDDNNNKKVVQIILNKNVYEIKIQKFILFENYSLEDALKIFFANSLMHKNQLKEENIDIGLNDNEFILGLEIIRKINDKKNKNIVLKLFNFYPNGIFENNYFSLCKPNFSQFLKDLGVNPQDFRNKILLIPLTIYLHFSLLLFYNKRMYILDFILDNLIDDNSTKKDLNKLDNQITSFLIGKKYDDTKIWKIIDDSEDLNDIVT